MTKKIVSWLSEVAFVLLMIGFAVFVVIAASCALTARLVRRTFAVGAALLRRVLTRVWSIATGGVRWTASRTLKSLNWLIFKYHRLRIHYFVEIDEKEKCPGCGCRQKHPIRWVTTLNQLIHNCERCGAIWASPPVAAVEAWQVVIPEPLQGIPLRDYRSASDKHIQIVGEGTKFMRAEIKATPETLPQPMGKVG